MADISELLNLIKAVNYYKAGGGNKKPGVGELFTAIGQGAAGVGQGLASAAQPKLALKELERKELDRKRGVAGKILDASLAHGENSYSSDQMNSILESGQFPSGVQISGGKEAKQSYIYDEATGTFKPGPVGVERNQILPVKPRAEPKGTNKDAERRAKLQQLKGALKTGVYVDPIAGETKDIETMKEAQGLAYSLGFDATDPEIAPLLTKFPGEPPAPPPKEPGIGEKMGNAIKGAFAKAAPVVKDVVKEKTKAMQEKLVNKTASAKNPYAKDFPDAYFSNGEWRVSRKGKEYRIQP